MPRSASPEEIADSASSKVARQRPGVGIGFDDGEVGVGSHFALE